MLDMVPLSGDGDVEDEDPKRKSATAFFAIPTAKRKTKEPDPPPSVPPASAPSPGAPPPGMGSLPPHMAPPPGGMPGGMGIQGPVAGGQAIGGPVATQGYGAQPMMGGQPPADANRAQSYRVFALLALLGAVVISALIVAAGLAGGAIYLNNQESAVAVAPPPQPAPTRKMDTGLAPAKVVPVAKPKPKPRSGPSTPRPAPKPAPPPEPTGPAPVTITITDGTAFTGVEIGCASVGFRERGSFAGTTATVANVPMAGDCKAKFKGGVPAQAAVAAGKSYKCAFVGAAANCK